MAKGEAWREGSGCGGRDGADCGERGDARVLLCQALSCGSCGLQSTHDWEAEGVAGDPTLEPTTSLSLPSLPPALSVPLSLHTHCLVPTQASSSFPGPLPTPSLLLVSVHTQGGPRGFFLHPGLTLSLPCSHTSHGSPVPPDKVPAPQPGVPLSPIRALYFTSHGFTLKLWVPHTWYLLCHSHDHLGSHCLCPSLPPVCSVFEIRALVLLLRGPQHHPPQGRHVVGGPHFRVNHLTL